MLDLSRRAFTLGLSMSTFGRGTLPTHAATSNADEPPPPDRAPPMAWMQLGRFTVTALADGYADMPFSYFPGRTAQEVEAAAKRQFAARSSGVRFLFNQYLIEDGNHRILIDTGPAGSIGRSGHLPQALSALGLTRDQIDAVIVTHMHQDHIGGLVAGGKANFSRAELYIDRREIAYWTDPAKRAGAPDYLHNSFRLSSDVVRLYPRLQAIDGAREIVPGVSIVDLSGHTPGHLGVRIADAGESLLMVSDMLFPVVHPEATDTNFLFEQDREAARLMRMRFFPLAAAEGALIAATHMPFPGLGRILSQNGHLHWLAAAWAHQE